MTEYLIKEGINFLIPRYYKNRTELLDDSIRLILRSNQTIRIEMAISLYMKEKISLSKAAEIAEVTTVEFKEILAEKGYRRVIEGEPIEEIDRKIEEAFR
jgi:predicted HTH domain antitoxin